MNKGKDGIYNRYIKRILDFTISLFALIILLPLLVVLTVVGAIAMRGNPFFTQMRPGMIDPRTGEEKIFRLIKFRTMSDAKDKDGNLLPDGKRLNGYGRFIRKISLDELPQFLNVLVGDMAFIGPRPLLVEYLPLYNPEQRCRHLVRPGITGYAQVHGRNAITWEEKFELDTYYVDHLSFGCDIKVVFDTVKTVLRRSGVSSNTSETMEMFTGTKVKDKVKL